MKIQNSHEHHSMLMSMTHIKNGNIDPHPNPTPYMIPLHVFFLKQKKEEYSKQNWSTNPEPNSDNRHNVEYENYFL